MFLMKFWAKLMFLLFRERKNCLFVLSSLLPNDQRLIWKAHWSNASFLFSFLHSFPFQLVIESVKRYHNGILTSSSIGSINWFEPNTKYDQLKKTCIINSNKRTILERYFRDLRHVFFFFSLRKRSNSR